MPMFLLFLKRIPWQAWALLAILIAFAFLRAHWIGVGVDRCEAKQKAAQSAADKEAKAQEAAAPIIAQEAEEALKPVIETRIKYVEKYNTIACDEPYPDELQQAIREASAAANRMRPEASADTGKDDN